MAPKEPFKVHSLQKHIENTRKGMSAEAQYNHRPASRPAGLVKKEPAAIDAAIFGDDGDDSDESSGSDSSSDDDAPALLKKTVTAKAATKAAAKAAPPKRSNKDVVADSDAERNSPAKKTATTKKTVRVKPEPESSEESTSESESEESEPKVKANGAAAPVSPEDTTSSESTSESGSDAESESESGSGSEAENESESEAESDSEPAATAPAKVPATTKPTVNGNGAHDTTSTSSDEDSDSESSSGVKPASGQGGSELGTASAAESEASEHRRVDESMHMSDREEGGPLALPSSLAPDFVLRRGEDGANGRDVAELFSQANTQGKQFWYFTVPKNVPVSVVQNLEIPMTHGLPAGGVFSHEGEEYGISLNRMAPRSTIQILIPSANGPDYQPAPRQIDQVMQVKKTIQLNSQPLDRSTFGPDARRGPPPQPKNMKVRYRPFGVPGPDRKQIASGPAAEDASMVDAPALPAAEPQVPGAKVKEKTGKRKEKPPAVPAAVPAAAESAQETPKLKRPPKQKDMSKAKDTPKAAKSSKEVSTPKVIPTPTVVPIPNVIPTPKEAPKDLETPKAKETEKLKGRKKKQLDAVSGTAAEQPSSATKSAVTPPSSRKGKRKLTGSDDDGAAAAEQLMAETMTAESRSKKQKLARGGSVDLGTEQHATTSAKKETPVPLPVILGHASGRAAAAGTGTATKKRLA